MGSDKFISIAKGIAKRDKIVFDQLIEFENTKKIRTKERLNFTIDKALATKFRRHAMEKGYNMSAKIEKAIQGIIDA
jgi:hypothetical protein